MKNLYLSLLLSLFVVISFQKAFDPTLSRQLLRACTASYCAHTALSGMKCGAACTELNGFSFKKQFVSTLTNNEAVSYSSFIHHDSKKIIFAFRGSQGAIQLMKEAAQGRALTYDLHYIPNALATDYFFTKYKNFLRADFLAQLRQLRSDYPSYTIYLTGHSLGGAFATLAALDVALLKILPKDQITLYTFGSPRVGDYNLAEAVNNNVGTSYRVVHSKDIVPHLPPCITDFKGGCTPYPNHPNQNGFVVWNAYHVGTEVFYDDPNPNVYRICYASEDPTCSKKYGLISLSTADHTFYHGLATQCQANQ